MDWVFEYVDQTDLFVLTLLAVVGTYVYWNYYRTAPAGFEAKASPSQAVARPDRSFLGRMKAENRQVLILYGSQTGTAEELAGRLAKDFHRYGKKALVMDPEEIEPEELHKITGEQSVRPSTRLQRWRTRCSSSAWPPTARETRPTTRRACTST